MATKARRSARKKSARSGKKRSSARKGGKRASARKGASKKKTTGSKRRANARKQIARVRRVTREVVQQATTAVTAGVETLKDLGENLVDRYRT